MSSVCGGCGALYAQLKCPCILAEHYCNVHCQKADLAKHRDHCSENLLLRIKHKQTRISQILRENRSRRKLKHGLGSVREVDVLVHQQDLAILQCKLGGIMAANLQTSMYSDAYAYLSNALQLHRKVEKARARLCGPAVTEASQKLVETTARAGVYDTFVQLAGVCRMQHKDIEGQHLLAQARLQVRNKTAHNNTIMLQHALGLNLCTSADSYLFAYQRDAEHESSANTDSVLHRERVAASNVLQQAVCIWRNCLRSDECDAPGSVLGWSYSNPFMSSDLKCYTAKQKLREAATIWHAIAGPRMHMNTLLSLAASYTHLRMFAKAHAAQAKALQLHRVFFDGNSAALHRCYELSATTCSKEAEQLISEVYQHHNDMGLVTKTCYSLIGRTVRVGGLRKTVHYNGLVVYVLSAGPTHVTVRTRVLYHGSRYLNLVLRPEHVHPLIATPEAFLEHLGKIKQLTKSHIKNCSDAHRVQLKIHGGDHMGTVITLYSLACARRQTNTRTGVAKALSLMREANTLRIRLLDDNAQRQRCFPLILQDLKDDLAAFDKEGVLSAMPCCWPCTSPIRDMNMMLGVFRAIKIRQATDTISSATMQQRLRLYGICSLELSESNDIDMGYCATTACMHLQKMKFEAQRDESWV